MRNWTFGILAAVCFAGTAQADDEVAVLPAPEVEVVTADGDSTEQSTLPMLNLRGEEEGCGCSKNKKPKS